MKYVAELLNITPKQFKDAIINADGSIYDAYAHNIGVQTAYARETGIISKIPTRKDGTLDMAALKAQLNTELDTDNGWRQYKKWLNNISDTIITSYDNASNEDIIKNMKAQPATAKTFKLTESGELVVPATEYTSIDEARKNKNRLSENAAEATKAVADEFLSLAKTIGGNTKAVVNAINTAFNSRYSTADIVKSFKAKGININQKTASELQALYKKAVELPTQYFEAKPGRSVGLDEIKAVIIPENAPAELKQELERRGIYTVEYDGTDASRIEKLNSMEDLMFSLPKGEQPRTVANLDINRVYVKYGDVTGEAKALDSVVGSLMARGKIVQVGMEALPNIEAEADWNDRHSARKYIDGILQKVHLKPVDFTHNGKTAEAILTTSGINHTLAGMNTPEKAAALERFIDLVANAEYAFSSHNEIHSNEGKNVQHTVYWDCFVAIVDVGGTRFSIIFKIRTIEGELRSQIHSIAIRNETGSSHNGGQPKNTLNALSNYGGLPVSGGTVSQPGTIVKTKIDQDHKLPIGEDTSPRALLANAFEGIVTNDIEKKKLHEYKSNVEKLDEQEAKLRSLRAEIKELSFAKGKRDTAKIKELQDEATKTANRISNLDKILLRLEAATPLQNILDREKKMAKKRAEIKGKEDLEAFRKAQKERNEKWQSEVKDKYQASKKKAIETRDKREAREKLQKVVLDTVKWITYPSKTDVKCPDILKQPYADFLNSIDLVEIWKFGLMLLARVRWMRSEQVALN